jgi:hypothetical protein
MSMDYRAFTVSAALAAGVVGFAPICRADIIASDQGIAVRDAGVAAPARGMTMAQVASKFGDPVTKVPAVGNPPISRWEYSGFVVYFERDHVIHAVVSASAPNESPAAAPPSAAAPAEAPDSVPASAPAPAPAPAPAIVASAAPMQAAAIEAPASPPAPVAAAQAPAAAQTAPAAPSAPDESEAPAQP